IRLKSRRPVFFRQTRVGLRGRPFTFLKFRSMRIGSDAGIHKDFTNDWIYGRTGAGAKPVPRSVGAAAREPAPGDRAPGEAEAGGPGWVTAGIHKIVRDPRVTLAGRLLRR